MTVAKAHLAWHCQNISLGLFPVQPLSLSFSPERSCRSSLLALPCLPRAPQGCRRCLCHGWPGREDRSREGKEGKLGACGSADPVPSPDRGRLASCALAESLGCAQEHTGLRGSVVSVLQETREPTGRGRVTQLLSQDSLFLTLWRSLCCEL